MKDIIFGGSGYLGEELVRRLPKARVVARNEKNLIKLKQKFSQIDVLSGDIADMWTVKKAMQGAERVFLLSAYKHVRSAEVEAFQCVKTNIYGLVNALYESFNVKPKLFLFISTDKAAQISGVYGATKYIGEKLLQEAERINPDTKYRCVRYGNVMYSTGSVMCLWRDRIQKGEGVVITDPDMTRFYWTREEAVDLIVECMRNAKDASPYTPKMKSMRLGDILEAMMEKYGKVPVKQIGRQQGENQHETVDGKVFSNEVERFTITEIIEKI